MGWTLIEPRYSSFVLLINFLKFVEFVFSLGSCGLRCVNKGGKSLISCNLIPGYKATKGENFERGCRLSGGTLHITIDKHCRWSCRNELPGMPWGLTALSNIRAFHSAISVTFLGESSLSPSSLLCDANPWGYFVHHPLNAENQPRKQHVPFLMSLI